MRRCLAAFIALLATLTVSCATGRVVEPTAPALEVPRSRVERADQLPPHVYPVPTNASALLEDDAAFGALARQLEADLRADLARYEIADRATLKSFYGTLGRIALVRGDWATAVAYEDSIRAIEDKPGPRLLAGTMERALAEAASASPAQYVAAFRQAFEREVAALPWREVQAELANRRAMLELRTPNLVAGQIHALVEPAARSGEISRELAQAIVQGRAYVQRVAPVREAMVDVLQQAMAAHAVAKPDIWAARDVALDGRVGLSPVTISIWDTGVDVAQFADRLWHNSREVPGNQIDDDGNGFVDDVHGIAHGLNSERTTGVLFPLTLTPAEALQYRQYVKGFMDLQAGLNTEAARAARQHAGSIPPAEARTFMENMAQYTGYVHGTHVAGIAARGNPAARLLVARMTFDHRIVPDVPTEELAWRGVRQLRETVEYFRQAGVRVVTMSWGFSPGQLERDLEVNNAGGTPEERRALALRLFRIPADTLRAAIASAPEILFVAAAGNDDADNEFGEFVPASFQLPNLITAGAVDRAGDEAAFTSYGRVDVYANGYEVQSLVPGGETLPLSGTSMAAPQVVNLAAKLLAVHPRLTVALLRQAILDGAEPKAVGEGKRIMLLNPARSLEIADGLMKAASGAAALEQEAAASTVNAGNYLDVPGGRIWYTVSGGGSGTPLVLLHGGPGLASVYLKTLEALGDERPVVRYDQLGAGYSDAVKDTSLFAIPHYVQELDSLRAHLRLERIHVYGHSWGSLLAYEYYRAHPGRVASLVLVSPVLDMRAFFTHYAKLLAAISEATLHAAELRETGQPYDTATFRTGMREFIERHNHRTTPGPDADSLAMLANPLVAGHMMGSSVLRPNGTLKDYDATPFLKEIGVPVLYLVGETDFSGADLAQRFAQLTPSSRLVVIPGSGHMMMWDDPGAHVQAVRTFFRELYD